MNGHRALPRGKGHRSRLVASVAAMMLLAVLNPSAGAQTPSPTPTPTPTASGTPAPSSTEPSIALLNPSPGYNPGLERSGMPDPPKVSDQADGVDQAYRLVAWTAAAPPNALVDAAIQYPAKPEVDLGLLTQSAGSRDVWESLWDIPDSLPEGPATIRVRLYETTPAGPVEVAMDEVEVEMRHKAALVPSAPGDDRADETVGLTWPQGGPMGFYKGRGRTWATGIRGSLSPNAQMVEVFYSTSDPGRPPQFIRCGTLDLLAPASAPIPVDFPCVLAKQDNWPQVSAVAAVAEYTTSQGSENSFRTQESADVLRVVPYQQRVDDIGISVTSIARNVVDACPLFSLTLSDSLGRPVVGANVDVHARGPNDNLRFGPFRASRNRSPDAGPHALGQGAPCQPEGDVTTGLEPPPPGQVGRHLHPGAPDEIHRESTDGTGLSGPFQIPSGAWQFALRSTAPGFSEITVWLDDEEMGPDPTSDRPPDDDVLEPDEPFATARAQFLKELPSVSMEIPNTTASIGACTPVLLKARSAGDPAPGINVDVHATGPDDGFDFCDPPGGAARRAPNTTPPGAIPHSDEDERESFHPSDTAADQQHTETETDEFGNAIIGVMSPSEGNTALVAWIDGETGSDNDVQSTTEKSSIAYINWGSGTPAVSFLSPSPYGASNGTGSGTQLPDSGGTTRILVRVDSVTPVEQVKIELSTDAAKTFKPLGDLKRLGDTDLWMMDWRINLPDGSTYALRAQIPGGPNAVVPVRIGAGDQAPAVPAPAYETLDITSPVDGKPVAFRDGALQIEGVASAGAEGIDFFYTKVPSRLTPVKADWILCGFLQLDGLGLDPQSFAYPCALQGADQASQISGVAAITFDCSVPGCDAEPNPPPVVPGQPRSRSEGQKETGDAVRLFTFESQPLFDVEPAESEDSPGSCVPIRLVYKDQTGQAIFGENIDVHVMSPTDDDPFCDLENGSTWRRPDSGDHSSASPTDVPPGTHIDDTSGSSTHHVESETTPNGVLVVGLRSDVVGNSLITAWVDANDDDLQDPTEPSDSGIIHWVVPSGCTILGTKEIDTLIGTSAVDRICGFEGDDLIRGLNGSDVLEGGPGDDIIEGGMGDDLIRGGAGADVLRGGFGHDTCFGGRGRDQTRWCEAHKKPA
jgi:hypothetical protein